MGQFQAILSSQQMSKLTISALQNSHTLLVYAVVLADEGPSLKGAKYD